MAEDLANYVREKNLGHVKVGVFDIDGVMRGKYMGRDKFLSSSAMSCSAGTATISFTTMLQ